MTDYTITTELFKLNSNIETLIRKMDELTFALKLSNQRGLVLSPNRLIADTFGYIPQSVFDTEGPAEGILKAEYPKDGFTVTQYTHLFDKEEENGKDDSEGNQGTHSESKGE